MSFGGMKATGVGLREMGRVAIDFYTELKAIYIDYKGHKKIKIPCSTRSEIPF